MSGGRTFIDSYTLETRYLLNQAKAIIKRKRLTMMDVATAMGIPRSDVINILNGYYKKPESKLTKMIASVNAYDDVDFSAIDVIEGGKELAKYLGVPTQTAYAIINKSHAFPKPLRCKIGRLPSIFSKAAVDSFIAQNPTFAKSYNGVHDVWEERMHRCSLAANWYKTTRIKSSQS